MKLHHLESRDTIKSGRSNKAFTKLKNLLSELEAREIPEDTLKKLNAEIDKVNSSNDAEWVRQLRKSRGSILSIVMKDLNLVPKNHYRTMWLSLGMAAIGIPLGVMFGLVLDNMAFFGIGLPIGLAIGLPIGQDLDNKAAREGRQLQIEV